jgi:ATPase family associated with various cellular activities (AAA)
MTLSERLSEYVRACFTGLWVRTFEADDALDEIARLCHQNRWALATWDVDRGLCLASPTDGAGTPATASDPLAAIRALNALASADGTALLVLRNFHRFLGSAEVVQAIDTQVSAGKQNRTFVVILAPLVNLPVEVEKLFVVIEHDLPGRDQIEAIARGVATEPGDLPEDPDDFDCLLDAAAGMTRAEAENAFALSLVRAEGRTPAAGRPGGLARVTPEVLWELKMADLRKSGLLEMHRGGDSFADLGGMENLKRFCLRALRSPSRRAKARGVLLLGPPGVGKSRFAKALGNEAGRPTVVLDLGRLKGSLVGQSEERTRQALRILSATRPNVAFADEIEKGLAAVQGPGSSDGGVSAGQFGALLTHMADHAGDSFFVFTANDVSRLPPEFIRAGRLNAVFFVDLPGPAERGRIWEIHLGRFGLDPSQRRPDDDAWSGAEVETCCETADLLDINLMEASQFIVPVAQTAGESVERLRNWAAGRCLSADRPGLYTRATSSPGKPGRSVKRDPSNN